VKSALRQSWSRPPVWYSFSAVGTARCAVRAAFSGAIPPILRTVSAPVPPLNAAGTPQRGVPTTLNTYLVCQFHLAPQGVCALKAQDIIAQAKASLRATPWVNHPKNAFSPEGAYLFNAVGPTGRKKQPRAEAAGRCPGKNGPRKMRPERTLETRITSGASPEALNAYEGEKPEPPFLVHGFQNN
jgi:hypothetical protein